MFKQRIETMYNHLKNGKLWNWRNREKLEPKFADEAELPDLEDIDVDGLIDEYEYLLDAEDASKGRAWSLVANGRSWEIVDEPATDEVAPEDCTRMWMRLGIRKVIADDGTIVFRVVRGTVIREGLRDEVLLLRADEGQDEPRGRGGIRLPPEGQSLQVKTLQAEDRCFTKGDRGVDNPLVITQ
jgi:hypothetical protein